MIIDWENGIDELSSSSGFIIWVHLKASERYDCISPPPTPTMVKIAGYTGLPSLLVDIIIGEGIQN